MYKLLFFVFLTFFITNGRAQDTINSTSIEQKSTERFLNKNWNELIKYGNQAIAQGYDYFYLRMRIGIACYEQKKYGKAVRHFEKAVEFSSSDQLALEYLYYSYIFSGRTNEARALTARFPTALREKIKPPKNKIIESLYSEGGIAFSNQNELYKNIDINGTPNIYGETTITNNMHYQHIGLNHQLGNRLSVYQGFSNIKIDLTRKISTNMKDTLDNYTLIQHDYYLSANQQFKHFSCSPAIHLMRVGFGKLNANYNADSNAYIFNKKDTSFINYATSLSLTKNSGIFSCNLSAGFSQLNGADQIQTGLSFTYFPLQTSNFYGTSAIVYLNENNSNRIIILQKAGVKIAPKLWAEAGITYGNLQNYCESNAFVVFNTGDNIVYKYGFSITSPVLKHFEFSLRYDSFNRENTYYRTNELYKIEPVTSNYNTQIIIGGIKWTF